MTSRTSTSTRRVVRLRRTAVSTLLAAAFVGGATSVADAGAPAPATNPAETGAVNVVGLREGADGPGVLAVQQKLIALGYYVSGGADGHFGPGTTAALEVFQQQNGLNPTGVVTENTAKYLGLANGVPATPAPGSSGQPAATPSTSASTTAVGLRRGASGAQVRALQERIIATTGLALAGGADGMFGPSTERAVKLVQRVNGLPETGVVDARTAQALGLTGSASSPSTPAPAGTVVQYGAQGAAVKRIQQLLIAAGVPVPGGADGIFGAQTRAAVRTFQQSKGLTVSGAVDAATDAALVAASGGGGGAPTTPPGDHGLRRAAHGFGRPGGEEGAGSDPRHGAVPPRRRRRRLRPGDAQRARHLPARERPQCERCRRRGDRSRDGSGEQRRQHGRRWQHRRRSDRSRLRRLRRAGPAGRGAPAERSSRPASRFPAAPTVGSALARPAQS